ncbi:hypothetical protein KV557_10080 [Kitasatospora aureofaciens]|uniref:hypothetical protein n=1 Tax=Kitasatospora aureofaciens TaxID=1894 RepID=UPI001C485A0B|nr:hypothetical protein [Kitasatospora aureofaciens]MBV6697472.1 hypothetical protein [Kitasatospora aureofaciens]
MTVSPWLVLAGALLGAGLGTILLALHPTGRTDQPPDTRQQAEDSGLIPRQGTTT